MAAAHIDPLALAADIVACRAGDPAAVDRLCTVLRPSIRREAARMLGDDDVDVDDVTQEALVAGLGYLRKERGFEGDLVRLSVTIARNRCRDLLRHRARHPHVEIEPLAVWLAAPERSALDDLDESELFALIQSALDRLRAACRQLLHDLYVVGRTPEEVRARVGLRTVKGIYHRRSVCLGQVKKLVQRHLRFGSWTETAPDAKRNHGAGGPDA